MGIRDALKSLLGSDRNAAEEDISDADAPEPDWFLPRYDGSYDARSDPGVSGPAVRLRFLPGGKVFESTDADTTPGPEQQNPCRGDYTPAGRFNVQRRFERIVSYAVLDLEPEGFLARRINAADRSTAELHFVFRPDADGREADPG